MTRWEIYHFEEPWKIIKGPWKTDQNMLKTWKWPGIFLLKDDGNPEFVTVDHSQTFLNTGTTSDETFQQSGKQDSFRHKLKSSVSMYESLGSQFFRTTTGIHSGLDTFYESRFFVAFLTIMGVTEILCSFRLVL